MRFSDDFIQKVIEANDLVDFLGHHTQLKSSGSGLMGLCPFPDHPEKSPSFSVSPGRQVYHCFGCRKSGNIITFLKDFNGLSFPDAIEFLAQRAQIELPQTYSSPQESFKKKEKDEILRANQIASHFFHNFLLESPPSSAAKEYILKRSLNETSLNEFKIGLAPDSWDSLTHELQTHQVNLKLAEKAELIRAKNESQSYYDFFRSRLMFPIFDSLGNTIAFGGRILGEGQPKYLNTPETPVFHKGRTLYGLYQASRHIRAQDMAILVEGYMDVITLHQEGIPLAIAPMGTALTLDQARLIGRYSKNITVLFDGDSAGQNAAVRSLPILFQAGLLPKGIFLPEGLDPDDFIKKYGVSSLQKMLDKAPDLFTSMLSLWLSDYQGTSTEKIQWTEKLLPLFASIPNEGLRSLYQKEASWKLGLAENWWSQQVKNLNSPSIRNPSVPPYKSEKSTKPAPSTSISLNLDDPSAFSVKGLPNLDLMALQMTFHYPICWVKSYDWNLTPLLDPKAKNLLQKAQDLSRQEGVKFDRVLSLLTSFVDAPEKLFMDQALSTFFNQEGDAVQERYFSDVIKKLQQRFLSSKIQDLQRKLVQSPSDNILTQLTQYQKLRQSLLKSEVTPLSIE